MDRLENKEEKELSKWARSEEFNQFFIDKDPSEQLDAKFYDMLGKFRATSRKQKFWRWFWRLALPIVAALAALIIGINISSKTSTEDKIDFASELLQSEKAMDKINLVSNTSLQEDTDEKVIDALLFALISDESINVRLACINTLYDYAYLPKVRAGLIQAVSYQDSPIVLANLAEAINASGKKLPAEEFKALINKELPPPIQNSINENLIKI